MEASPGLCRENAEPLILLWDEFLAYWTDGFTYKFKKDPTPTPRQL
ncbi:hypothetical protein F442_11028 [Phytophthora nicotianae P10297]|uniref:DDE-1 domain-containing protein n=1 Tax=Phytophthora nicotianae P10297 TaxID=1317064 RepID=W2Z4Y9_PHYNI|nr:hypothetical protein F442_11028 [Phytophthora nicotianae P10297]